MPLSRNGNALSYAVRPRVVLKYVGQLWVVFAALNLVPLLVSLLVGDYWISARYAVVASATAAAGWLLGRLRAPARIQTNEALVIAAGTFLFAPLLATWPMMSSGLGFLDAFFECVSGATTTGLSVTDTVEDKPTTFLFARAWMQWYGGLGIVVLAIVLVTHQGILSKRLAAAEADPDDPVGSTKAHFRRILVVYIALTLGGGLLLMMLGAGPLGSWLYAMAAISTGGYAPHDASLGALPTAAAVVTIVLSTAGAVSLVFYHHAVRRNPLEVLRDRQLQALVFCGFAIALGVAAFMVAGGASWEHALYHAPMMAFSAQTTAGFSTLDIPGLDSASVLLLIPAMFIGGGTGSTAGGAKLLRLLILFSLVRHMLLRTSLPRHAVAEPRLGGKRLPETEIRQALLLLALFVLVIVVSWLPFLACGYDPLHSLFEVASATGTAGISSGISRPELEPGLKLVLCADMLLGRLEIVAWLVMLYPRTWIGKRASS